MNHDERLARHDSLNAAIARVLAEHRDIIGPEVDEDGQPCHCPSDPCPCRVPEGYIATDWVLVSNWTDLGSADGSAKPQDDWLHVDSEPTMRRSQIVGILTIALDGARGVS